MHPTVHQLKATLAELPADDRAEIAYYLLATMEPSDADAQALWHEELGRRLDDARSGRDAGIAAEDAVERLRKQFP